MPGDNPSEREPITGVMSAIEAILREPRRVMFEDDNVIVECTALAPPNHLAV